MVEEEALSSNGKTLKLNFSLSISQLQAVVKQLDSLQQYFLHINSPATIFIYLKLLHKPLCTYTRVEAG
jgi:hypothetical protein